MDDKDLKRETFLDIQLSNCYHLYKTHQQSFWTPEEVDLSKDRDSFLKLPSKEQEFIKKISTFFLISDAIVTDNIDIIAKELDFREIKAFYSIQSAIENVHIEIYGNIFEIVFDKKDAKSVISEILNMESVIKKRSFCLEINKEKSLGKLILYNTLVEGIFFSASFSGILWLKKRGHCPGIVKANEWIARDERLHWRFGCEILKKFFINSLSETDVFNAIETVYQIEKAFVNDILPEDIGDMTKNSLLKYVKFCCNEILEHINFPPYFTQISQPFEFMKFLDYPVKANFFETRVTNYSLPSSEKGFVYKAEEQITYEPIN